MWATIYGATGSRVKVPCPNPSLVPMANEVHCLLKFTSSACSTQRNSSVVVAVVGACQPTKAASVPAVVVSDSTVVLSM